MEPSSDMQSHIAPILTNMTMETDVTDYSSPPNNSLTTIGSIETPDCIYICSLIILLRHPSPSPDNVRFLARKDRISKKTSTITDASICY